MSDQERAASADAMPDREDAEKAKREQYDHSVEEWREFLLEIGALDQTGYGMKPIEKLPPDVQEQVKALPPKFLRDVGLAQQKLRAAKRAA